MNGLLIIDKEKDYTSRDIVNLVAKTFNTSRVGHTGTLDPIATGVLVIALGNALKIVDLITNEKKEYIATVKLGISTDTLDVTGNILKEEKNFSINKDILTKVLNSFLGKSIQEVPIYSAVKVNGKRLYEYARNGDYVELPKREIEIFDIELLNIEKDEFSFRVIVSKGTYIRSLIRDIGLKLNVSCCMKELRRTKQGKFDIKNSISIDKLKNKEYNLIPIIDVIDDFEIIKVDNFLKTKILNGRILDNRYKSKKIAFVDEEKNVLAFYQIYEKDNTKIKPIKVLGKINSI